MQSVARAVDEGGPGGHLLRGPAGVVLRRRGHRRIQPVRVQPADRVPGQKPPGGDRGAVPAHVGEESGVHRRRVEPGDRGGVPALGLQRIVQAGALDRQAAREQRPALPLTAEQVGRAHPDRLQPHLVEPLVGDRGDRAAVHPGRAQVDQQQADPVVLGGTR